MPKDPATNNLGDVYADRIRADLDRVDAEIAEVRSKLDRLAADRAWLTELLDRLPVPSPSPAVPSAAGPPAATAASPEVPAARAAAEPAASSSGPASSSAPRRRRGTGGPTLVERVVRYLEGRTEPTSVLEVTRMLNNEDDRDRTVSTVVVRNTLEALVARGIAERSKDGRSVHYTLRAAA
ncbi:hypothetical protein [Actinacidiphila acididurans]|uniref:Uncharacterized protein n=1 Tax=Actinacidiphila acididurans TaxID=2784346 RepID=A0ABS2TJR8_9ACTN|nr:hypothetical protein [Actinacidiphila acididurans]MBM9503251.1 hypothetical protein [Actinacidiphila acididurans]